MISATVKFDGEVHADHQAQALMTLEKTLRKLTGLDVRVYKDLMGDDSKLRQYMTIDIRKRL